MTRLVSIQSLNPAFEIQDISTPSFSKYGKIIDALDFSIINDYITTHFAIPESGVTYTPSLEEFKAYPIAAEISNRLFGEMPIQIGYCAGKNQQLNALEYHKSSEVTVALTDLIIIVGCTFDIDNDTYDTKQTEIFYVPKDTAYELYASTLHYAPCNVDQLGFQTVVILPYGTNFSLKNKVNHDKFLHMKNKWIMCYPENKNDIHLGCKIGLEGENITINHIQKP